MQSNAALERTTFKTNRLLDFFSTKELIAQTGHGIDQWPQVVGKELIDNALDACEEDGIAPNIDVMIAEDRITVSDNGPGIAEDTVAGMVNYNIRISSREAYVAPDRGAQGNALKTIIAMPFVLDGESGRIEVTSQGVRHEIICCVDRIRQTPVIDHRVQPEIVKSGTSVTVFWPDSACSILLDTGGRFLHLAEQFACLNPHMTLRVNLLGQINIWEATLPDWRKWTPNTPTSPHWYENEHLARLISAYVAHDQDIESDRTVREFIREFRGLTGTAKQKAVLEDTGMARTTLRQLVDDNNGLDRDAIERLLGAMRQHTKPVKPQQLGLIGKDHVHARFEQMGCEMESFRFVSHKGDSDGVPWVIEAAFAWRPMSEGRTLITGVNWSAAIINPFRALGSYGESLDSLLEEQRVGQDEPVVLMLHTACPRVEYSDRGKSAVIIED